MSRLVLPLLLAALAGSGRPVTAGPATLGRAIAALREVRQRTGVGPTIDDFRRVASEGGATWDLQELGSAWVEFEKLQRPPISKPDLVQLLYTKEKSIARFWCRYRLVVEAERWIKDQKACEAELLEAGRRVWSQARFGPTLDRLGPPKLTSYDGKLQRDLIVTKKGDKLGTVSWMEDYDHVFEASSPLARCMLLDSKTVFSKPRPSVDLGEEVESYLYTVQEAPSAVDGIDGLVLVCSWDGLLWLDPRRGFALVKSIQRTHHLETSTGKFGPTGEAFSRTFSDWRDLGDGLFFPFTIETANEDNGKVRNRSILKVLEAKLNPEVEDGRFTNVFPRDTTVEDRVRDVVYLVGHEPSIAGVLDRQAHDRPRRYPFAMIVANVVALLALLIHVIRRDPRRSPPVP